MSFLGNVFGVSTGAATVPPGTAATTNNNRQRPTVEESPFSGNFMDCSGSEEGQQPGLFSASKFIGGPGGPRVEDSKGEVVPQEGLQSSQKIDPTKVTIKGEKTLLLNSLKNLLEKITLKIGEKITVSQDGQNIKIDIGSGSTLPVRLSVLNFLRNVLPQNYNFDYRTPSTGTTSFTVEASKVEELISIYEKHFKPLVALLKTLGFKVEEFGSKPCYTVLKDTKEDKTKNTNVTDELIDEYDADALALSEHPMADSNSDLAKKELRSKHLVIFPDLFRIYDCSPQQCAQMESYFREAKLIGHNGRPKEFDINGKKLGIYQSNVSIGQAVTLFAYLQQLEFIQRLNQLEKAPATEEVLTQKGKLYSSILDAMKKYIDGGYDGRPAQIPFVTTPGQKGLEVNMLSFMRNTEQKLTPDEFAKELAVHATKNLRLGPVAYTLLKPLGEKNAPSVQSGKLGSLQVYNPYSEEKEETNEGSSSMDISAQPTKQLSMMSISSTQNLLNELYADLFLEKDRVATNGSRPDDIICLSYLKALSENVLHKKNIPPELKGQPKSRTFLDDLRSFMPHYNPSYFIQFIVEKLGKIIEDIEKTGNSKIQDILLELGVAYENLNFFKIKGSENYNRFQVNFALMPLVVIWLMKKDVLLNPSNLNSSQKEIYSLNWFWDPEYKIVTGDYASWSCGLEWAMNHAFDWTYKAGGSYQNTEQTYNFRRTGNATTSTAGTNDYTPTIPKRTYGG